MILGPSTSHKLQAVIGVAGDLRFSGSKVAVTPGSPIVLNLTNTIPVLGGSITGTGAQDLLAGVATDTTRLVDGVLRNHSGSVTTPVTLQRTDGTTTTPLDSFVLLPSETLAYDGARWIHKDANGAEYGGGTLLAPNLGVTGTLAETMPRELCPEVNTTGPATGVLWLQAVYLRAGQLVSNITLWSATTAAGTPTHQMAGLFDASRNLLATSTDRTTEAWSANSAKTFPMSTPYAVPASGLYYIGFFTTATTVPTLKGGTAKTGGQLAAAAPILGGASASTGLTTALPNPAGAITASTASIYASVS